MITAERIRTYLTWCIIAEISLISVSIAAASVVLAVIFGLLILLCVRERSWIIPRLPIDAAVAAYIAAEFLSAAFSDQTMDALKNSKRLLLIVMVYATAVAFTEKVRLRSGLKIFTGAVAFLSVAEIVLHITQGTERLYVFQHYMTTGGLKMIVTVLMIPFIIDRDSPIRVRKYFGAMIIPILTALILTNTRSAWLGLIAGVFVIGVVRYRTVLAVLAAAIVLFFLFGPEQQVERAKSIVDLNNSTNVGRFNMWSTGFTMWKDKPLLGFGDIDLYQTYLTYRTPTGDEPAGHLHNNYVHLLVTLGAVGLSAVLFLFVTIMRAQLATVRKYSHDPFVRNVALGSLAVFAGFAVNGMFEWNFGDHEVMIFVWTIVGWSFAAGTMAAEERR